MKLRHTLASCLALTAPLQAAPVSLTASDALGNSSFNAVGFWSNAAAPAVGNTYSTGEFMLRTPTVAPAGPFAGDSLTVAPTTFDLNKALMLKGPGYPVTINNLTVNGGYIRHAEGTTQSFALVGNLAIGATGARFNLQGPLVIDSLVSGSGPITVDASNNDPSTLTFTNAANTYNGNIINNGRFAVASTGKLNFVIGASGVSNTISGTGPKTNIDGALAIDLTAATLADGDVWNLVGTTAKNIFLTGITSGAGAWTQVGRSWVDPTSKYRFEEISGKLKVIGPDADHDLYSNQEEINAGTDPNNVFSSPDADADGMVDGYEVFYFGDYLTEDLGSIISRQNGTEDPDIDGYFTLAEAKALPVPTNPNNAAFTPLDTEGDGLVDAWESFHFTNLTQITTGNPDADAANNLAEQLAGSYPLVALSTPTDTDGNGIPDASEELQPYATDADTLHLWHLDEMEATYINLANDEGTDPIYLTSLANGATLWQRSLPGFKTALDPTAGRGTTTGGNLAAYPLANGTSDSTPMILAGADGAFTFEAVVRIDFNPNVAPASVTNMQIFSGDNDDNPNRLFQFRLIPIGNPQYTGTGTTPQLEFINISLNGVGSDTYHMLAQLPEGADPDAIVQGGWFHVAVSYNGTEATADNVKLYWTRMDGSRSAAREIFSGNMGEDLSLGSPDFVIGNEGRDNGGATENFQGLIDEVRISSVARPANGFYFSGVGGSDYDTWATTNSVTGGANGDDDFDSLTNDKERLFGLNAKSGASANPIAVPFNKTTGKLSYTRRKTSLTNAAYSVWTSTTLSGWAKDNGAVQTVTATVGEVETVEITLSAGLTANPKLFVRVQAN
ncbi:MAG: LamG-like jellyroll fold domain-containing protein [Verrucomicrobiota bacterium]